MSETLYNGIVLPDEWPPRTVEYESTDELPVPYLDAPPDVIPVDVGRQLFVDDFLIARSTLRRTFHTARLHPASPVLVPETEQELDGGHCPGAGPFNDGVWFDPEDGLFKMWYMSGWLTGIAHATSTDGISWQRPKLDVIPGTNQVLNPPRGWRRDGGLVWRDPQAGPAARYRMFLFFRRPDGEGGRLYTAPDGIHWKQAATTSPCGDNTTFFYNPFRNRFVFSIRQGWPNRGRAYHEHPDFVRAGQWTPGAQVWWARADRRDKPDPLVGDTPQLYDLNAVAYESIMLGAFNILYGPQNHVGMRTGEPKIIDMQLGFSRDGFHFSRPHRHAFIPCSRKEGTWNRAYIHTAGGLCLVRGDELWFYYTAFSGKSQKLKPGEGGNDDHRPDYPMYAGASTGLAVLRRDGFASMDAPGNGGSLETRPVTFTGNHLFVNADLGEGELRAEVLAADGSVIAPFSRSACVPVTGNTTKARVTWRDANSLAQLSGRPVRFRFLLTSGRFYAFWVSAAENGDSNGHLPSEGPA